jgi:D-tyrosyl-tRNA(Tyr) deacylase
MRAIIQRVKSAKVIIDNNEYSSINHGLIVFVGIENSDVSEDINWLINKILNIKLFNDHNDIMNNSIMKSEGEIMVISQFTLFASTKKGNRPSYIKAAKPEIAIPIYNDFCNKLRETLGEKIKTGVFGANMQIELTNDGPVSIIINTKNKE